MNAEGIYLKALSDILDYVDDPDPRDPRAALEPLVIERIIEKALAKAAALRPVVGGVALEAA